jgi:hypothetical protein
MHWWRTLLAGAALVTLGCAGMTVSGNAPATGVAGQDTGTPTANLTLYQLKNASYPTEEGSSATVQLHDGSYIGPGPSGSGSSVKVSLRDNPVFGDLDGDGVNDAALILITDNGLGSTFYELEAVLNQGGTPAPLASYLLGDRVRVNDIGILAGRIYVNLVRQGPYDAITSPTLRVKEFYALQGGQIVLAERKELTP